MSNEITEIIEELKAKLKTIESKIVFNYPPVAVKKPSPPTKSKTLEEGRPNFFQVNGIILNAFVWVLPIIYLQFVFFEIQFIQLVIIVLVVALATRLYVHLNDVDDFDKKTKAYNLEFRKYEDKLSSYKNQVIKYEEDIKQYQIVKQRNDNLKREKDEIQEELVRLYEALGANKSSLSPKEKRLYLDSLINENPIIGRVNRGDSFDFISDSKSNDSELNERIKKGIDFISKLSVIQRKRILNLLKKVQDVQNSNLNSSQKTTEIKRILWTDQSSISKLFIGGLLGTIGGLMIFGTGGIGIAGLGGAVGIWGFLTGTAGGVLISSLIQNFEKRNKK